MQLFLILWFILFFYIVGKGIAQFIENEHSPVLTVPATIVNRRRKSHHHKNHHSHTYHITFEFGDGQQLELKVRRQEYRELSIGDRGILTHQGTRFQGFERS